MSDQSNTAIVLVNLGTPDEPTADAIRRYLKQFLSDPRVVDLPRWLWLPILNGIILRTRPPKLVENYSLVWGTYDGPIRTITAALAKRLQSLLPEQKVVSAMTYGEPSLHRVLDDLRDYEKLVVVPLFPQYAGATTGAVRDALDQAIAQHDHAWQVTFIDEYHAAPGYITSLADSIRRSKSYREGSPKVVFSFHGIPQSQAKRGDPYPEQCHATASLVAAQLDLPADRWMVTFQSRFGPAPWLQPYTDKTMEALPEKGVKDVLIVCPGFATDCLETIEEIKVQNQEIFLEAGGQSFSYVKALNASWDHARCMEDITSKALA